MAIMHPKNLNNFEATKSEAALFNALEEQLDDSYHIFYSVTWYTEEGGERVNSECDLLIFNSNYGYLTIEVKGGTRIELNDGIWTLYSINKGGETDSRILKKSPYKQAEASMHYFRKYYKKETLTNFRGTFGMAVAFPFYSIDVEMENDAPEEITIQLSDMNNLDQKVKEIFHYWGGKNGGTFLSNEQAKKFINLVNRRIALSIAAGALIPITSKKLENINIIQNAIITLLSNYKKAQIIGGAGTGKTWIAIKKLAQQSSLGKRCLYICFSKNLAIFVKDKLPEEVDCLDIEFLFKKYVGNEELKIDGNGDCLYFDILQRLPIEKYDCIMVDEAQDFSLDWALSINLFVKDNGVLYVFYDENQNIYSRNFEDGFLIDSPPYLLTNNIRNTRNIHQWVKKRTNVGEQVVSNDVFGSDPEVYDTKSIQGAKIKLNEILNKLIIEECVNPDSIAVLSNIDEYENEEIGNFNLTKEPVNRNDVKYSTVADYKGLESDIVIYISTWPFGVEKNKEYFDLLYLAGTRSKYFLYVINVRI